MARVTLAVQDAPKVITSLTSGITYTAVGVDGVSVPYADGMTIYCKNSTGVPVTYTVEIPDAVVVALGGAITDPSETVADGDYAYMKLDPRLRNSSFLVNIDCDSATAEIACVKV